MGAYTIVEPTELTRGTRVPQFDFPIAQGFGTITDFDIDGNLLYALCPNDSMVYVWTLSGSNTVRATTRDFTIEHLPPNVTAITIVIYNGFAYIGHFTQVYMEVHVYQLTNTGATRVTTRDFRMPIFNPPVDFAILEMAIDKSNGNVYAMNAIGQVRSYTLTNTGATIRSGFAFAFERSSGYDGLQVIGTRIYTSSFGRLRSFTLTSTGVDEESLETISYRFTIPLNEPQSDSRFFIRYYADIISSFVITTSGVLYVNPTTTDNTIRILDAGFYALQLTATGATRLPTNDFTYPLRPTRFSSIASEGSTVYVLESTFAKIYTYSVNEDGTSTLQNTLDIPFTRTTSGFRGLGFSNTFEGLDVANGFLYLITRNGSVQVFQIATSALVPVPARSFRATSLPAMPTLFSDIAVNGDTIYFATGQDQVIRAATLTSTGAIRGLHDPNRQGDEVELDFTVIDQNPGRQNVHRSINIHNGVLYTHDEITLFTDQPFQPIQLRTHAYVLTRGGAVQVPELDLDLITSYGLVFVNHLIYNIPSRGIPIVQAYINSAREYDVQSLTVAGSLVTLTLDASFTSDTMALISYRKPSTASQRIQDTDANEAPVIIDEPVVNRVPAT